MRAIAAAAGLVALTGCATNIQVTYDSDPRGATIYEGTRVVGATPLTVEYTPDATFKAGGCQQLRGTEAKWASGATASISFLSVCANLGWQQHYVFPRPNIPGREIDANYALQLQRNRSADVGNLLLLNALTQPQRVAPVTCSSYRIGSMTQTDCR